MKSITHATAQYVLQKMFETGKDPLEIVKEENLWAYTDEQDKLIAELIAGAILLIAAPIRRS